MSAGIVHARASMMLTGALALSVFICHDWSVLQVAAGALLGTILSPDLDVDAGNLTNTIIRKRLGRPLELLWDFFWHPYRRSLKHGGEFSHFPVVSTLIRLAYIYFFLIIIPEIVLALLLPYDFGYEMRWWLLYYWILPWRVWLGLMGADLIHWSLDVSTTEHKQKRHT